jgi:hypothetical protein
LDWVGNCIRTAFPDFLENGSGIRKATEILYCVIGVYMYKSVVAWSTFCSAG